MTVQPTDIPGTYFVGYYVDLRDHPTCDCKSGQLSDRGCHHIRSAQEFAKGQPVTFWRDR